MRGSYAECKAELEHVSSLWGPPATVSEIRVLKTELPLTAGLQAYHDNESWTWEVNNHRLALVLFLWIGQNTQRRLESEDRRGALSVYVFWSGAGSKIQPVLLVTLPRTLQICIRCTKGIHILSTFPRGFITT